MQDNRSTCRAALDVSARSPRSSWSAVLQTHGVRKGLGAILVGYFDDDDLVYAGKLGTGFDTKLLLELRAQLDALEIP
jgi:ATP dependent DNA ligase C terminal region